MNSSEIRKQLRGYKNFVGVFPCDSLPQLQANQAMIVNTDPHNKPGEHWVAFYMDIPEHLEYFDSFGLPPIVHHLRKYINSSVHNNFVYSSVQLQHNSSDTCGNHCIAFVKHRLNKQPFVTLLAHFTSCTEDNDNKVHQATQ